jgi:phosphatidate cytidylyltransferase
MSILFLLVMLLASHEFKTMTKGATGIMLWVLPAYLFYTTTVLHGFVHHLAYLLFLLPILHAAYSVIKLKDAKHMLYTCAGAVLYIAIPLASVIDLHVSMISGLIVPFFIMIWANDTGAYLVGRAIGKTKLAPKISPKKTIEGLIGGIIFCIATALITSYFLPELSIANAIGIAVVVGIFSNIGDLFESALKRIVGVKDSGHLFPGHGGFLDRFDSVIFAAPATLIYIKAIYPWL